jgi:hypothetical protein
MNSTTTNSIRSELLELFNSIIGTISHMQLIRVKSLSPKNQLFFLFSSIIMSILNTLNTLDTFLGHSRR